MADVKKEWYKHGWGLVVAILFFPYFLIWYAWAKSNWSKNLKIGLTSIIAVIMIPFTIAAATTKPADTNNQQNSVTTTQEQSESETQKELEAKKAAEEAAQEEAEKKAAEEAAQKKTEEEAAAVAAAKAKEAASTNTPSQTAVPATTEDPNLPLKAICNDGSISYQDTPSKPDYRGMCSGHDGIKTKLGRTP